MEKKFSTLAAAAAYCKQKGHPFTWIHGNGPCVVKPPAKKKAAKKKAAKKGAKTWARATAVSRLKLLHFYRVGDSNTYVQAITGRKAWLTPVAPGRVSMKVETIAALNARTSTKKKATKKKAKPSKGSRHVTWGIVPNQAAVGGWAPMVWISIPNKRGKGQRMESDRTQTRHTQTEAKALASKYAGVEARRLKREGFKVTSSPEKRRPASAKKKAKRKSVARSTVKGAKRGRKRVAKKTPNNRADFIAAQLKKGASRKQAIARWNFKQKHKKG